MRELEIYIELNGDSIYVGNIIGNSSEDACFSYSNSYLSNPDNHSISISLPLSKRTFDSTTTRNFFEGLLPEGFTRKCVAKWIHANEDDYLSILLGLGQECLGAIKVFDKNQYEIESTYQKLTYEEVQNLAKEGATESAEIVTKSHLSLTGASGKVGLYYDGRDWYLPIGEAPSTHIVKQSHIRLKRIVANEQLCLLTAKKLGIEVPDNFVISLGSYEDNDILFATKRYDRIITPHSKTLNGMPVPYRLHQEDFCQALCISSSDKYEKNNRGYMKAIFELIRNYSSDPISDQAKLWDICIFNYLIGNTDNHIKNLSLIYNENLRTVRLAPAYDIISTIVYKNSSEDMSMSINNIYNIYEISRDSFEKEARNVGLGPKMAMQRYDYMSSRFSAALISSAEELKQQGFEDVGTIRDKILDRFTPS